MYAQHGVDMSLAPRPWPRPRTSSCSPGRPRRPPQAPPEEEPQSPFECASPQGHRRRRAPCPCRPGHHRPPRHRPARGRWDTRGGAGGPGSLRVDVLWTDVISACGHCGTLYFSWILEPVLGGCSMSGSLNWCYHIFSYFLLVTFLYQRW